MKLADHILVPLSFAITVIGGGAYWLASLDAKATATVIQLQETKGRVTVMTDWERSIDHRLSVIEGEVLQMNHRHHAQEDN